MRVSQFYLSTLKEAPAEAEIVSQQLMLRAGHDQEARRGHLHVAAARPAHAAQGRGDRARGDEPRRRDRGADAGGAAGRAVAGDRAAGTSSARRCCSLKDRHDRDFAFGPTHEEVITDIVRKEIRSYRQLPLNFYQIQVKFRDEIRPRFGVMRAREFIMKDAYSFDVDEAGMLRVLPARCTTPTRASSRGCGLEFRAVEADTGAIGGSASHEFQVLADSGEDAIAWCPTSDYAANVELAEALAPAPRAARRRRADAESAHARHGDVRGGRGAAGAAARADGQVHHAGRRRRWRAGEGPHAADPRRSHAERDQGHQDSRARAVPLGDRGGDRRRDRLPSPAISARSAFPQDAAAHRRPVASR